MRNTARTIRSRANVTSNLATKKRAAGAKAKGRSRDWIVLGHGQALQNQFGVHGTVMQRVSRRDDLAAALSQSTANSLWIVASESWTDHLLKATSVYSSQHRSKGFLGDLILCEAPSRHEVLPSLHTLFRRVVGEVPSFKLLPRKELAEVLASDNRRNLVIGGVVDVQSGMLTLARGDLQMLTVPLSIFLPPTKATRNAEPDFARFEVADFGQTIRFGDYETSTHSMLYQFDPEYRREVNKKRTAEEKGFGPSLRRLRLLRGLRQDQFPGISSKTIARIEQGKTGGPHAETLGKIAETLAVTPAEIEGY